MWKALLKYGTDIIHIMPGDALMEGINLQNPSGFVLTDVYFFAFATYLMWVCARLFSTWSKMEALQSRAAISTVGTIGDS